MGIREVAAKAAEVFKDDLASYGFQHSGALRAVRGYFKGVADGSITVGQAWLADILVVQNIGCLRPADREVIEAVFASGMCCGGQTLTHVRGTGKSGR